MKRWKHLIQANPRHLEDLVSDMNVSLVFDPPGVTAGLVASRGGSRGGSRIGSMTDLREFSLKFPEQYDFSFREYDSKRRFSKSK